MRRFVVGDIHGAAKALDEVLKKADFDEKEDLLVSLGDVVDGWPESKQVVERLLSLKNMKMILGNHDAWFLTFLQKNAMPQLWTMQGGEATLQSYNHSNQVLESHRNLFENAPIYLEIDDYLFVHGGFDPDLSLLVQSNAHLMWDRTLIQRAWQADLLENPIKFGHWLKIFIGHTPVSHFKTTTPGTWGNVVAMDTDAGWDGKLSLMDIDTGEFWQSTNCYDLYPEAKGRRG